MMGAFFTTNSIKRIMKQDYFFGLDIIYAAAVIFFLGVVIYLFWISRKGKKNK